MVVHNPNNWHWVDKNCIDWTKVYFNQNLVGLSVSENDQEAKIESVSSLEGDVEVCQRKGKVISLFDLKLVIGVGGYAESKEKGEGSFNGSITIPELAYDTEYDEYQFEISIYNENPTTEKVKPLIKNKLIPKLREIFSNFGHDLIKTHSSDIQLSSDQVNSTFTKANQEASKTRPKEREPTATTSSAAPAQDKPSSMGVPRYNTTTLHLESSFNTTAEQLYISLTDPTRITAWAHAPPRMEPLPCKENTTFSLFGGNISGKFIKLEPNHSITEDWRLEDWKKDHYARIEINLAQGSGETKMVVKWSGVPVGEEERVRDNFEEYYIRAIKLTFGFGLVL